MTVLGSEYRHQGEWLRRRSHFLSKAELSVRRLEIRGVPGRVTADAPPGNKSASFENRCTTLSRGVLLLVLTARGRH